MHGIHSTATVTSKGQITLPKFVRQALELDTGTKLSFALQGENIVLTRAEDSPHHDAAIRAYLHLIEQDITMGQHVAGLPAALHASMQSMRTQGDVESLNIEGDVDL